MKMDEERIFWAVEKAKSHRYWPALLAGAIDWERVFQWVERVEQPDFTWEACDGYRHEPIIVGPASRARIAIHTGTCRILAGLLADRPVPETSLTRLGIDDPTRPWEAPTPDVELATLLPMDRPDQAWAGPSPSWLNQIGTASARR